MAKTSFNNKPETYSEKKISYLKLSKKGKTKAYTESQKEKPMNKLGNVLTMPLIRTVSPEERPVNVLDRQPDDHEAKSLVDIVNDFCDDGMFQGLLEQLIEEGKLTVLSYDDYPQYEEIELSKLMSALVVQRPINKRHLKKIQLNYNRLKVQYPIVLKIKFKGKWYYYIVDGQHTAASWGIRARLGCIKEVPKERWTEVKVRCTVVECDNFTFAREVFLGINGDDKLELDRFDKWKNYVLGKRQDSPDEQCDNELWEDCHELQCILEHFNIIPVHGSSKADLDKPGAFVRVDKIQDQKPEDVRWIARLHQMIWDDKPMDSFEVIPMIDLKNHIRGDNSLDNPEVAKFVKELGALIRNTVETCAEWRSLADATYKVWYNNAYPDHGKKQKQAPDEADLALLIFCYKEAGGSFKRLRTSFLEDFQRGDYTLFDALSRDGVNVDEDLKNIVKGQ